MEEYVFQDLIN